MTPRSGESHFDLRDFRAQHPDQKRTPFILSHLLVCCQELLYFCRGHCAALPHLRRGGPECRKTLTSTFRPFLTPCPPPLAFSIPPSLCTRVQSDRSWGPERWELFRHLGLSVFPGVFPAFSVAPQGWASVRSQAAGSPKGCPGSVHICSSSQFLQDF